MKACVPLCLKISERLALFEFKGFWFSLLLVLSKRDLRVSLSDIHCNIYTSSEASHNLLPYINTPILYLLNISPKFQLASMNKKTRNNCQRELCACAITGFLDYCKYRDYRASRLQKKSMKSINDATDLSKSKKGNKGDKIVRPELDHYKCWRGHYKLTQCPTAEAAGLQVREGCRKQLRSSRSVFDWDCPCYPGLLHFLHQCSASPGVHHWLWKSMAGLLCKNCRQLIILVSVHVPL